MRTSTVEKEFFKLAGCKDANLLKLNFRINTFSDLFCNSYGNRLNILLEI